MNLTINFPSEYDAILRMHASAAAKTPEEFAVAALLEKLKEFEDRPKPIPRDAWLAELATLSKRLPGGNVDADISRDSIYEGRGE
jgi:hypothetical protein